MYSTQYFIVVFNKLLFLLYWQAEKCSKFQMQTHLISLCLADQAMATLFSFFEMESPISKVASQLRVITNRKGEAASLAKQGLHELEIIITNTEALGVKVTG